MELRKKKALIVDFLNNESLQPGISNHRQNISEELSPTISSVEHI